MLTYLYQQLIEAKENTVASDQSTQITFLGTFCKANPHFKAKYLNVI